MTGRHSTFALAARAQAGKTALVLGAACFASSCSSDASATSEETIGSTGDTTTMAAVTSADPGTTPMAETADVTVGQDGGALTGTGTETGDGTDTGPGDSGDSGDSGDDPDPGPEEVCETHQCLFVATDGSDRNPGTQEQPFRTLNHGVTGLLPGGYLWVGPGLYEEELRDVIPSGLSWDEPVTVRGLPGPRPTLRPPADRQRVLFFSNADTHHIVVSDLILDAINVDWDVVKITLGGESTENAHHIRLKRLEVMNSKGNGILVGCPSDGNEFLDLDVHDNGDTEYDHGIYFTGPNNLIANTTFHHNSGFGIHMYLSGGSTCGGNRVMNNIVHSNGEVGILIGSGDDNVAYNNLVYDNGAEGITIGFNQASNNRLLHNTVVSNDGPCIGIGVFGNVTDPQVLNNLCSENEQLFHPEGDAADTATNLDVPPSVFVDAGAHDYHLQPGSDPVDAGVFVREASVDREGKARAEGSVDVGAYEL